MQDSWRPIAMLVVSATIGLAFAASAAAATIPVNDTADVAADDGGCTLREAITAANNDAASGTSAGECPPGSGADTVSLPGGTYRLTQAGAGEDANATGDLDLAGDTILEGAGTAFTTIDANHLDRALDVQSGTVAIDRLTVTGGRTPDGADGHNDQNTEVPPTDAEPGGGIRNRGTLTVSDSAISGNTTGIGGTFYATTRPQRSTSANGGAGGGIESQGAALTLRRSTVSDNTTGRGGGPGTAVVDAMDGGDGGAGAGLSSTNGMLLVLTTTIARNRTGDGGDADGGQTGAGGCGGGIYSASQSIEVTNTTITANKVGNAPADTPTGTNGVTCFGGGIYNAGGPLRLHHVTMAYDRSGTEFSAGDLAGYPEIFTLGGDSLARNTLIVNLSGAYSFHPSSCGGLREPADGGHDLSYEAGGSTSGCPGLTTVDPQLGQLADNGGLTPTMSLSAGSPAVDAVPPSGAGCETTDQRGVARPQGPACDVGAYELVPAAPTNVVLPSISGTPQPEQTLTADAGSWTSFPTSFGYQWKRCDAQGAACANIDGATADAYTPAAADLGKTLIVAVTATNSGGSSTPAESAPVGPVASPTAASPPTPAAPDDHSPGPVPGAGAGPPDAMAIPLLGAGGAPPTLRVPAQTLGAILRRGAIRANCTLDRSGNCAVRATIPTGVVRALGRRAARATTLGVGRVTLPTAGSRRVIVKLRRTARNLLAHARRLRITLRATAITSEGSIGPTVKRMTVSR